MNRTAMLGIFLVVISQLAFAGMDSVIKWLSSDLSTATIILFRNLITLLWVAPVFLYSGQFKHSLKRLPLHAVRSLSGQIGMVFIFISLAVLPLADASVLRSLTPLFVPILAAIWLKEKLSWILIPSFILATIGSWILAGVDKPTFSMYSFLPIIAGIFVAMAMVSIKRIGTIASGSEIVFYFSLTGVIFAIVLAYITEFTMPSGYMVWLMILLMGAFGSVGQIWITKANQITEASILAPFYYLNAVFGAILSHFFWNETLGFWGWFGATIIIAAGLLVVLNKKKTT